MLSISTNFDIVGIIIELEVLHYNYLHRKFITRLRMLSSLPPLSDFRLIRCSLRPVRPRDWNIPAYHNISLEQFISQCYGTRLEFVVSSAATLCVWI
jgi:hypothetical protein